MRQDSSHFPGYPRMGISNSYKTAAVLEFLAVFWSSNSPTIKYSKLLSSCSRYFILLRDKISWILFWIWSKTLLFSFTEKLSPSNDTFKQISLVRGMKCFLKTVRYPALCSIYHWVSILLFGYSFSKIQCSYKNMFII